MIEQQTFDGPDPTITITEPENIADILDPYSASAKRRGSAEETKRRIQSLSEQLPFMGTSPLSFRGKGDMPPDDSVPSEKKEDVISKLERLARLKEKGVLSEEEFVKQKKRLLY